MKKKKIFRKTFRSMQNFLKCLINDVIGFLEGLIFIDASLPNIHVFSKERFSKQQQNPEAEQNLKAKQNPEAKRLLFENYLLS